MTNISQLFILRSRTLLLIFNFFSLEHDIVTKFEYGCRSDEETVRFNA